MIRAGIVGATGYVGSELVSLLLGHRQAEITCLMDVSSVGKSIAEVWPHLAGCAGIAHNRVEAVDIDRAVLAADIIFLAMPHGKAAFPAKKAVAAQKKVIDIGADFRLADVRVYEEWYKVNHEAEELLPQAVYGLPELFRREVRGASLIGNPGCYPTAAILALAPLLKAGAVKAGSIIIDAKSGVSGAGKTPASGNIYCEVADNLKAYNIAVHRHTPEIEQAVERIGGIKQAVSFTPHLVPMSRGILATVYANLAIKADTCDLIEMYDDFYKDEQFVYVCPEGIWPQTKWVRGTNNCQIGLTADPRTGRAVIVSVIDNLVRGAAGQAIQNMNLMFGLPEETGLLLRSLTS